MTNKYLTGNPLGSTAPKDLYDNASNIDDALNSALPSFTDRFGKRRETWAGMEAEFDGKISSFENEFSIVLQSLGYEAIHLTYVPGSPLTVDRATQLIDYLGSSYKVKTPATSPLTLTGNWGTDAPLLLDVGDAAMRSDLANGSNLALGAALIARAHQVVTSFAELRALNKTSPSKYVVVQGKDFISPYTRDDSDISSDETVPTVIVATDGARYKLVHNGTISAEQCGLVGDGVTINLDATVNAVNAAVLAAGAVLTWRPVRYVCEHIGLLAGQSWLGYPGRTELMAKNNLNADFVTSNFSVNTHKVSISGIRINGNKANNTSGRTFRLKGGQPRLRKFSVINAVETAMETSFDIADGEMDQGFEGIFDGIILDKNDQHGWLYDGPTDSSINNLTIIDPGLKTDNTYYGFRATRNYRGNNIHTWNRGGTTNTPSAMMQIEASAPGCTGVNCHFEGGHTPIKVLASSCSFTASDYYATRGDYCIENYGLANQFHGVLGATSADINPDYNGVLCAGGNSRFDLIDVGCRNGAIDFTNSQGGNSVVINGWRATGIPYYGAPAPSDDVDLFIGGLGGGQLVQQRRNPMKAVNYTIASEGGVLTNATASGYFADRGSMLEVVLNLVIISNGSGAQALLVTVPWVAARTMSIFGYESSTGKMVRGTIQGGTSVFRVVDLNNAYAGANGMTLILNGEFERN